MLAAGSGGRAPSVTELQRVKARQIDEVDERGKHKYTVEQIAETFGVSRNTIYRNLERSSYPRNRHR